MPAARQGWIDAGLTPATRLDQLTNASPQAATLDAGYSEGMIVRHERYGQGRVTQVSGFGVLRKMKIRFATAGERTFYVEKAKLEIIGSK